jgi:hypothetical protein
MGVAEVVVSLWFSALSAVSAAESTGGTAVAAEASKEKLPSLSGICTGFGAEPDMTWMEFVRE